jgi:hypothetical protein
MIGFHAFFIWVGSLFSFSVVPRISLGVIPWVFAYPATLGSGFGKLVGRGGSS